MKKFILILLLGLTCTTPSDARFSAFAAQAQRSIVGEALPLNTVTTGQADVVDKDTEGFTNPDVAGQFTVPANTGDVNACAVVDYKLDNVSGDVFAILRLKADDGGNVTTVAESMLIDAGTEFTLLACSGDVALPQGTTLTIEHWPQALMGSVTADTVFTIEGENTTFNGALLQLGADQNVPNGVATELNFTEEIYDDGGWHDDVTPGGSFIVPAGVSRAKFCASVVWYTNGSGWRHLVLHKNGSRFQGGMFYDFTATVGYDFTGTHCSAWVPVVEGDEYSIVVNQNSGVTLPVLEAPTGETWFSVEGK